MNKNKHLVRSDRDTIKSMLDEKCNFTQIAEAIGKDRTTISREVRNRSVFVRKMLNTPFTMPASIGFHVRKMRLQYM